MNAPLRIMTNDNGMEYFSTKRQTNDGREYYDAQILWYGVFQTCNVFLTIADTLRWFRKHGLKGKDRQVDQYGRVLCAR